MKCPDCGENTHIDITPEKNSKKPFERVCFECGWLDPDRYRTRDEAEAGVSAL
jgi:uncharacterized Zn finger protein